tara:strand:- start:21 stop:1193 length:1173 start_codon:yes stop_codon:yes gene_type:complete
MAKNWIQFLSTYPPRECGIATFCSDLLTSIEKAGRGKVKGKIAAMNEKLFTTYNYPARVNMQIEEEDPVSYLDAAEKINQNKNVKLVCIQHEFGIFGGNYGDYLIPFLEELEKPVVTTFHSVLPGSPKLNRHRKYVVQKICKNSAKAVVISGFGHDILKEQYGIKSRKIVTIPHGVPKIDFGKTDKVKKSLGLNGRKVISTFGLMSKRKGMQYVINALPRIVKKHPEALYLIIGETHPTVRGIEGEKYRNSLKTMIKEKGLQRHVKFYNEFLPLNQLCRYIQATDVYITPYYDPNQISSGTLAYAVGAGKACVSTPYLYARDALRDSRGLFVDFKSSRTIADAINRLFDEPGLKQSIEINALSYGRAWYWENIGNSYLHLFNGITNGSKN